MKVFNALLRRQLMSYFCSPGAYLLMAVFLAVSGLNFCSVMSRSMQERMEMGDILFGSWMFWFAVLVAIALISMRLFAEEKRSGTIELLLTAPVTDTQVVMAKYFGALIFFGILSAPTILNAVVIVVFGGETGALDMPPLAAGYLMFFLTGACYMAFGLLVSSLTRSQTVAGILCFAGICIAGFSGAFRGMVPGGNADNFLEYLSGMQQVLDFSRGLVDTRPVVSCVSGTVFFLFSAIKVIEARQWKQQ